MKIIRAGHMGMCFGVRDAIQLAKSRPGVTVLGDLVHNQTVLGDLEGQGVKIVHRVADIHTETVMITAHGASDRSMNRVHARGLKVVEATCPLVKFAHTSLRKLVKAGGHPVVIGKRDHVEVRGLTEDFDEFDVVLSEDDIERLVERPCFGVVAQTTQPIRRVLQLVELIRRRFPESDVRFIDTVCQPTKQRQNSAAELARQSDVVVVIGGANSNNTHELVATCNHYCANVHHVQTDRDLRTEWFDGADTVGVTAGTSTPDDVITRVESWLEALAAEAKAVESNIFNGRRENEPTPIGQAA